MFLAGRPSQDSNGSLNNIRLLCRLMDNYIGAMAALLPLKGDGRVD